MSQIHKRLTSSSPIPPIIPTEFETQDGSAVPAANILIIDGIDSSENNANGIITKGGVTGTGTANEVDIVLTNRLQGTVTTVGVTTSPIITFNPTAIGTYTLEVRVAVFNTTSTLGAGYSLFGSMRFDGVNAVICDTFDEIINEEGTMTNLDISVSVSVGSLLINGTGYLGQTINWSGVALYTYVGA